MANIQTIKVNETDRLSKAIRSGKPFYICDKNAKVLAYDPEKELAEQKLTALLQEAEACREYCSVEECLDYLSAPVT
jgi:hypothetical protein